MGATAKPIHIAGRRKGKHVTYTIEECQSCHAKTKRAFRMGDYVYKQDGGKCSGCESANTMIIMIFSEPLKSS